MKVRKEKKARVEDARHATKAAVEEGIVPGGGVVLTRAAAGRNGLAVTEEIKYGMQILRRALNRLEAYLTIPWSVVVLPTSRPSGQ